MHISKDWNYRLSHSFWFEHRFHKATWRDALVLISLTLLAASWYFFGAPYDKLSVPLGADPLTASPVQLPRSLSTALIAVLVAFSAFLVFVEEAFQFLDWKDDLLSEDTLRELAWLTAPVRFTELPELAFNPPLNQMTNQDLSKWCRRYNRLVANDAPREDLAGRSEILSVLDQRLCGDIAPRPARIVKRAWYTPKQFELAYRDDKGWYFDAAP